MMMYMYDVYCSVGPYMPATPSAVTVSDITHDTVTIAWSIIITVSPETYIVVYGTTSNGLNMLSTRLSSGLDFSATNQQYQVQLNHLEQDRIYYYVVIAWNQYSLSGSSVQSFRTTSLGLSHLSVQVEYFSL